MDILDLEERIKALEDRACCNIIFYSELPVSGKARILYINETTGDQYIWNGTEFVAST